MMFDEVSRQTETQPTAVAVSGGIDSLYALTSMKEQGESVLALHGRMLPPDLAPAGYEAMLERLATTCAGLGVPFAVIDCVDAFAAAVITPFVQTYAAGKTPNPCARCNATIKFGLLLDRAREMGAARLATGHYARLEHGANGPALYAGEDASKDQSYFLSLTPLEQLRFAVFPLAMRRKDDIRASLAARAIIPPAPDESQEICFVRDDDYRAFLTTQAAKLGVILPGPGPVVLPEGQRIGSHNGLWQYTEGQRKGLGIAWSEPLYVLAKDGAANALVVGTAAHLARAGDASPVHGSTAAARTAIRAGECNFLVPMAEWPKTVLIRTRFRQIPRPASASFEDGMLVLREETPSGPYARGQIATVYDQELRVLAGGVIE